jgi:hypothetical protein
LREKGKKKNAGTKKELPGKWRTGSQNPVSVIFLILIVHLRPQVLITSRVLQVIITGP